MPKTMTFNTTVTFGGANFPVSSVSYDKVQDMVDTTTTADGGFNSVTPGLIKRSASLTVYIGSSNMTLPAIGANGTFNWTGGESFPAIVSSLKYGAAQVNGAIPVAITFDGNGA